MLSLLQKTIYEDNNIINENNIQITGITKLKQKIKTLENKNIDLATKNTEWFKKEGNSQVTV